MNRVDGLAVAADGVVWLCAEEGVTEFDGQRWIQHYLGSRELGPLQVRAGGIGVAPDGTVWVVAHRITSKLDGESNSIPESALCRYDGQQWEEFVGADGTPYPGYPLHLFVERSGVVWTGNATSWPGRRRSA